MRKLILALAFIAACVRLCYGDLTLTAGEGIDIVKSGVGGTVTVSGEDSSTTNKGIASFNSSHFTVSSGAVSLVDSYILSLLSASTGISYNATTGAISCTITQYTDALARATISSSATGITYTSATGIISLTTGYGIPTTTQITNWDTAYGWGNHASAGYITGNQSITLSGDVSGTGTTAITATVSDDSHAHTSTTLPATTSYLGSTIGTSEVESGVTVDTEWDTAAEINAATTDTDFLTAEVDGSITNEIEVVDEVFSAANFNGGTTSAVSQDDFYDILHALDTDDDGDIDTIDATVWATKQAADADLTTYAGITPSANAQTLLAETFAQMQASLSIDDLITLSGVAEGSVNLATFTGATIADNVTIKAALQALETAVEGKEAADANIIKVAEIDTLAELEAIMSAINILAETEIDASSELLALVDDETGTGVLVFNNSPTFADDIQLGLDTASGILKLYSEQGATDYIASLYPNTAMTSAASFYLPADEPAATSFINMTTGGVMGFVAPHAGTNIANDLEEEVTEGSLADSTIVSADIKNGEIVGGDLNSAIAITSTGAQDYGGAASFEIPNGATVTDPAAAGQVAIDTTTGQLLYHDGTAQRVLVYNNRKCFGWFDPADADDDIETWIFKDAATVTNVSCRVSGGTSLAVVGGDGTNSFESITCDADGATDDGSITNATFTAGEVFELDCGAPSGTVPSFTYCIDFTTTAD